MTSLQCMNSPQPLANSTPRENTWQLPVNEIYNLSATPELNRQEEIESKVRSYPRRIPISIQQAKGALVVDERQQVFLDCLAGAGALALGHNHPEINAAVNEAMNSLRPFQTLDITTPEKDAFMAELLKTLPKKFSQQARLQFCGPSGADAVEAAIKLVKTLTGRNSIISFQGGYHGMTHGALSLTGNLSAKTPLKGLMADVHFMPFPYPFRSPFGLRHGDDVKESLHYLKSQLHDPEGGITKPAAIIVEAVQGEGGVIPAPIAWLKGLREITTDLDIPLIIDEIQTGFGRTGEMFAFQRADITPDIVIMSKAIGGGLPLSVIAFKNSLDAWSPGAHTGTFRGNQMAMVSGRKTLEIIRRDQLHTRAEKRGKQLKSGLQALQKKYPQIGEVRGVGLMVGMELVCKEGSLDTLGNPLSATDFARKVQQQALKRGLICELGGRHGAVVRFLPPLIITPEQIQFIITTIDAALSAAEQV